jgi:hypothetical protein
LALTYLPILAAFDQAYRVGDLLSYIVSTLSILILIFIFVFRKKLIARHKRIQEKPKANRLSIERYRHHLIIIAILLAVGFGSPGLFQLGVYSAKNMEWFYVVKQSREGKEDAEFIVLGNYGDYLVAVPFKRSTKTFERKVILLKMSDMNNVPLSFERLGKLTPPVETKPQT